MFESLSRTVTCIGELLALICVIPRGKDLIPPCLDCYIWYCIQWFSCCSVVHWLKKKTAREADVGEGGRGGGALSRMCDIREGVLRTHNGHEGFVVLPSLRKSILGDHRAVAPPPCSRVTYKHINLLDFFPPFSVAVGLSSVFGRAALSSIFFSVGD